ncbi:MAG: type II secretion system protein [Christensenella sp.]|nr:type II secretion system protein [Christensenella sp.]
MKKQKRKNSKNRQGFTLVELVIAIAVFAIFSVGACAVLVPVFNIYGAAAKQADAQVIASDILGAVQSELAYAYGDNAPVISEDGLTIAFRGHYGDTQITAAPKDGDAGYLYMMRGTQKQYELFYDSAYYKGDTVTMLFEDTGETGQVFHVTVTVLGSDGKVLCQTSADTRPLAFGV